MSVNQLLRYQVWQRDSGICRICEEPVPFDRTMHLDHIWPRSAGGPDTLENLRTTHRKCNVRRGDAGYRQRPPRTLTTSIRLSVLLQAQLRRIAQADRRTTNAWICLVLEDAVKAYLASHPEFAEQHLSS